MAEQNRLLEEMLARAEVSVKELGGKLGELEVRQDLVGLEGTILETVLRLGASWLGLILSLWAANLAAEVGTRRACVCGATARWVSLRAKTILTLLGKVTYRRVYYHCQSKECRHGEALGDREWGLEHTRTTPGVKRLLSYVSASIVGFSAAASLVCRTMRWPGQWLSGKQVQRLAEPLGTRMGELEAARIARWWKMATTGLTALLDGSARQVYEMAVKQAPEMATERFYVQMDGDDGSTARGFGQRQRCLARGEGRSGLLGGDWSARLEAGRVDRQDRERPQANRADLPGCAEGTDHLRDRAADCL